MTKIEAYENKLIKEGMTKEAYAEYETLLKRVRGNFLRLQHCYTTAVQFPIKRSQEGIDLIQWALEKFPDTWFPTYSAYYSAAKDYTVIRELPTGEGFADMVFIPKRSADVPAMIVELKWDKSAEGAIGQIQDKGYVDALKEYKGNLLLVGINYDKKTRVHQCKIEKYEMK